MQEIYKRIKIAGIMFFIPLTLAAGPLSGYFLGDFLQNKFGLSFYFSIGFVILGFIASIVEVVRIVRLAINIDKS